MTTVNISGGDPTGTGRGGASIYGRNFSDEIHDDLKHTGMLDDILMRLNKNSC